MNKFLTVIFFILLVLLVGELGYIFYVNQTEKNIIPVPMPTIIVPSPESQQAKAISTDKLAMIGDFAEGVTKTAILTTGREGSIVDINLQPGIFLNNQRNKFNYAFKLSIKNNGSIETYYYGAKEVNNIKAFDTGKGKDSPIGLGSLKVNDNVKIEETDDLTKPSEESLQKLLIYRQTK